MNQFPFPLPGLAVTPNLALLGPLTPQPSTLTGTIYIDPQNVQGTSSDSNDGKTTATALRTWRELVRRWGTTAPLLTATTSVIFLSSHTDNSDPVVWSPIVAGGTGPVCSIQGAAPTVLASGVVLAGTVAKNRAAGSNSLLHTNLGASGAVGVLVENTTHPSRAWAYKSLGANVFEMTQPLVKTTVPGTGTPAEVDTWADGDLVNLLQPIAVNIISVTPIYGDRDAGFDNRVYLYQLTIFDPQSANFDACVLGISRVFECKSARILEFVGGVDFTDAAATNCFLQGAVSVNGPLVRFAGGATTGQFILSTGSSSLDGDFIIGGTTTIRGHGSLSFGTVFLDGNVNVQNGPLQLQTISYGAHIIYGRTGKNVTMAGTSHLSVTGGTFAAALTAPDLISPGIKLNGSSLGHSVIVGSPDVLNGGIATTPANLDAAAGAAGFGGNAFNLGGASIGNFV